MIILHVEDSRPCRAMLKAQLPCYAPNATLVQRNDVKSAREWLTTNEPTLAILDVQLPDGDGAELLPLLSCKVVFVTANTWLVPDGYRAINKGSSWIKEALK